MINLIEINKTKKTYESFYNFIVIFLFISAILIPAAGHISGVFDVSYIKKTEKRSPNNFPEFPDSFEKIRTYPRKVNACFNDYFGFRSWLVSMNNKFRLKLGASPSDKVIRGKGGWLFYTGGDMVDQYRGINLYTSSELNRWIKAMEERKAWLAKKKIPFIIAIPPNKMTIYSEYLPNWISKVSSLTRIDQLMSVIDSSQLDFVDLRKSIFEAKKNFPVYYMTDSHWNFHGGFTGYQEIMQRVKKYYPSINPLSIEDVNISYFKGLGQDLCNILNISKYKEEPFADRVILKKPSKILSVKHPGKGYIPKIVTTKASGMPRVLVFRDSYTNNIEPFFNETFKEIIYVGYGNLKFDTAMIEKYKPDLVLHIIVERSIRHRPFNPMNVGDGNLRISNWGPTTVQVNKKFNVQRNNMSAFYLIGENISPDTVIIWNKNQLKTIVDMKKSVLSALVPDNLYTAPGKYEIKLYDPIKNKYSKSVYFCVTD